MELIGMYTIKVIEHAAFMYLRSLSFNQVIAILGSRYEQDIFTKDRLIRHIEELADQLPGNEQITTWLKPKRSGYYAVDGTWMKYRGRDIVLMVFFDSITLDIISFKIALDETYEVSLPWFKRIKSEINGLVKGLYTDGEPGVLKALQEVFSGAAIQLCVFHKYQRAKQIVPFIRPRTKLDKQIKEHVQKVLFAESKQEAENRMKDLELFAKEHQGEEKLKMIVGVLKRNFDLLLTHFEHPEMSAYNNVLEGFNHVIKRRIRLMKGFKKPINIKRWIKLLMLDWRFHPLVESVVKERRNKSPLHLAGAPLPEKVYNWMSFVRKNYKV
jgi:transposase-like protein